MEDRERKEGKEGGVGRKGEERREKESDPFLLITSHLCFIFLICFFCPTVCTCNYPQYFFLCFLLSFHIVGKCNYLSLSVFLQWEACCSEISKIKPETSLLGCRLVDNFFLSPLLFSLDVLLVIE